jgi:hypothetical protein
VARPPSSRHARRAALAGALLLAGALACGLYVRADDRILHEFVPDASEDEGTQLVSQDGAEPAAIVVDGEVLPPPASREIGADERPMRAQPGQGAGREQPGRRATTFRPDRVTDFESTLHYFEVFTPAIAPYKRVSALDAVALAQDGKTPELAVARTQPRVAVPIEGASAPPPDARPRDAFWGSVVLEFEGGTTVPLPSVAPESRVLTLRSEPEALLRVERDSADNFYVVAAAPLRGEVRLTFLMDAPRGYFSRPLSPLRVDTRAAEVPALPASVAERAIRFAGELGVRRGMPFDAALRTLVAHFRAFEESSTPPTDSGDIYLDLARGKKGVCRHRAYAFVITAQALGVPARFVQNEAHAWVEVKQPDDSGWMRIDLGGAADGLEAHGARDAPMHRPDTPDLLPRPEAFERSYSQQRGASRGGGGTPLTLPGAGGGMSADPASPGSAGGSAAGDSSAAGATSGNPLFAAVNGTQPTPAGTGDSPSERAEEGDSGASWLPAPAARVALAIDVQSYYREVFRGRELLVLGRVTDTAGVGVAEQRVEVSLRTARGDRALLLGVTVSAQSGDFRGNFGIPPAVPVGDYQLLVVAPGDARHAAAVAR